MEKPQTNRSSIVGVRFSVEERECVERAAALLNQSVSEYVRRVSLAAAPEPKGAGKAVKQQSFIPAGRSWREELLATKTMTADAGKEHVARLANGRKYPAEFSKLNANQRVEWLDKNWPLEAKA